MPLVTAKDFPGLFATPDQSGLARGVYEGITGLARRAEQRRLEEAEKIRNETKRIGAQMLRIRDIKDPEMKRRELALMGRTAAKRGEDDSMFMEALGIENDDQLNVYLARKGVDAIAASDKIDSFLASRLGISGQANLRPGAGRFAQDKDGNKFHVTPITDPTTGSTSMNITPLGDVVEPVGALEFIGGTGETAEEKREGFIEQTEQIEEIKTQETIERERGKKEVALDWDAKIKEKVKEAEVRAQQRGETLNEVEQMEAALPGLNEAVDNLRELSEVATYTTAGRVWDAAVRELGFGATEGATARAKYIAIVNNQILPLLKPTFGAQFTEREGEALKITLGDPNSSPAEKQAQLEAFIEQKARNIRDKRKQINPDGEPPAVIRWEDL